MAAFTDIAADSAAADQRDYDPAGIVRANVGAEKSRYRFDLGAFSRRLGAGAVVRW